MAFEKNEKTWEWTRGEKREALKADLYVLTNEEVAGQYGISQATVARYRVRFHIPSPVPRRGQKVGPETEKEIVRLRQEKFTYDQIVERTGVNKSRVLTILADHGLAPRQKKHVTPAICITKHTATPAFYDNVSDTFELDETDRRRYERLRSWKIKNAQKREKKIAKRGPVYWEDNSAAVY